MPSRRARPVLCGVAGRPTAIAAPAIATAVNPSPSPMTPDRRAGAQTRIKLGTTDEREGARRWMAVAWRSPAKAGPRAMESRRCAVALWTPAFAGDHVAARNTVDARTAARLGSSLADRKSVVSERVGNDV